MANNSPIGVFDSGIGGLSVLNEVCKQLPHENIIYFGDTKNLPYGDKSPEAILGFNINIFNVLVEQGCKMVISACNTSSAIALDTIEFMFPKLPIVSLINPGANAASLATRNKRIGVIATIPTVNSEAYPKALYSLDPKLTVEQVACPEFVPLVESGKFETLEAREIVKKYLAQFNKIDTLIYGCTHYPALEPIIKQFYPKGSIIFIDPAVSTVLAAKNILDNKQLNADKKNEPVIQFIWSGATPSQFDASKYCRIPQTVL